MENNIILKCWQCNGNHFLQTRETIQLGELPAGIRFSQGEREFVITNREEGDLTLVCDLYSGELTAVPNHIFLEVMKHGKLRR